jgi:hypothetical protein
MERFSRVFSVVEILLALQWIYGGVKVFVGSALIVAANPFVGILVGQTAVYFYGIFFFATGLSLLYSKFFKKKTMHKFTLATMYLTCVYVLILALVVLGPHLGLINTIVAGILSAACWMHWKFKTEYIDPQAIYKETLPLRDDLP